MVGRNHPNDPTTDARYLQTHDRRDQSPPAPSRESNQLQVRPRTSLWSQATILKAPDAARPRPRRRQNPRSRPKGPQASTSSKTFSRLTDRSTIRPARQRRLLSLTCPAAKQAHALPNPTVTEPVKEREMTVMRHPKRCQNDRKRVHELNYYCP